VNVLIRADASRVIGAGHVVRCLALAAALRECGARVSFISRSADGDLAELITAGGNALHLLPKADQACSWQDDCAEVLEVVREQARVDWLVVDHYGIDRQWEAAMQPFVRRQLVIDDLANRPHAANLLVDPNISVAASRYRALVPASCRLMLGPRYALLRPEFVERAREADASRDAQEGGILACVGGADPQDILSRIVEAWQRLPVSRPALQLVVGSGSPNVAKLRRIAEGLAGVTLHVQTARMAELMDGARFLICAAGSISWERCCLGRAAIMGSLADNQRENLEALTRLRTGLSVGQWVDTSVDILAELIGELARHPGLVRRMGARSRRLVDGRGAGRVSCHMAAAAGYIVLRPATLADATPAWQWRNAEVTRRHFANSGAIELDRHLEWWATVLADHGRDLLIAVLGARPVGVLRLDHRGDEAVVSVYVDPALTGVGLGPSILRAAQQWVHHHRSQMAAMVADILPQNTASASAFAAAGFARDGARWKWLAQDRSDALGVSC
jgi:UDP-2,4-diacetamido-2,4,6-trideoxy-beta-L-altropyranose hydrolase